MNPLKMTFLLLALALAGCSSKSGSKKSAAPTAPTTPTHQNARSGILSIEIVEPPSAPRLAKALNMTHARLQIVISASTTLMDTSFTLTGSAISTKTINDAPIGENLTIRANIFSVDDTLTHTGETTVTILAAETTTVNISTLALFGFMEIEIVEIPSNIDSGYVSVSGSGMATVFAPLAIDPEDGAIEFDGTATGTVEYIGIGTNRTINVFLLTVSGQEAYTASVSKDISAGLNTLDPFPLTASSAKITLSIVEPGFDTTKLVSSVLAYGGTESAELIFSEIYYNSTGTDNNEWVEILNTTGSSIDLSLYGLVLDGDTILLSGTLAGNARFVVGESDSSYVDLKASAVNITNSGESILDIYAVAGGALSDRVRVLYLTKYGWPSGSSSSGISLELEMNHLDAVSNNHGQFWEKAQAIIPGSSPEEKGTPGS